jgi:hypothetical protein
MMQGIYLKAYSYSTYHEITLFLMRQETFLSCLQIPAIEITHINGRHLHSFLSQDEGEWSFLLSGLFNSEKKSSYRLI